MGRKLQLEGKRFNRLLVLSLAPPRRKGSTFFLCRCDCGTEKVIQGVKLMNGDTQSCGCLQREATSKAKFIHGMSHTPIFRRWAGMQTRCFYEKDKHWKDYGGRGITVCERWRTFSNFLEDMGESFEAHRAIHGLKDTTIERINVDGNYEPSNCRWATQKEQGRNRRNNVKFRDEIASDAAKKLRMRAGAIGKRLKRGWSKEDAFTVNKDTPTDYKKLDKANKNSKSGIRGVYQLGNTDRRKRWIARFNRGKETPLLKYFLTKEEAEAEMLRFRKSN